MRERLRQILRMRSRISTQIYLGIGGAVALTVAASLVGWLSFNRVGDAQQVVNEGSVPELTASFGVAQFSGNLVAAAPRLISATTQEEFQQVSDSIDADQESFELQLAILQQRGTEAERFQRIRTHADTLTFNIEAIEDEMSNYFQLVESRELLRGELVTLRSNLENELIPAIDDQLFYTITGYRALGEPPDAREIHFTETEFSNYRYLSELLSDTNIATELCPTPLPFRTPLCWSLSENGSKPWPAAFNAIWPPWRTPYTTPNYSPSSPVFSKLGWEA